MMPLWRPVRAVLASASERLGSSVCLMHFQALLYHAKNENQAKKEGCLAGEFQDFPTATGSAVSVAGKALSYGRELLLTCLLS